MEGCARWSIIKNAFLVDNALGAIHIALIPIESVDAGLQSLLDDILLYDQVTPTPILAQVRQELVAAEIDARCGISTSLLDDL